MPCDIRVNTRDRGHNICSLPKCLRVTFEGIMGTLGGVNLRIYSVL